MSGTTADWAVKATDVFAPVKDLFHLPGGSVHLFGASTFGTEVPGVIDADGFRRFSTDEEGERYGETVLGPAYHRLSVDQKNVVTHYSLCSEPFNSIPRAADPEVALLRMNDNAKYHGHLYTIFGRLPTLADVHGHIGVLDGALTTPLLEGVEANRTTNLVNFMKGYPGSDPRNLIGTVQTEQAYLSTSLGSAAYQFSHRLHLRVPCGQPALWIGRMSAVPEQRELLLPRGTSYYINAVFPGRFGGWDIYATVLPGG